MQRRRPARRSPGSKAPATTSRRPTRARAAAVKARAPKAKAPPARREGRWLVEQGERLLLGAALIRGRRPDEAIALALDPLIADQEKKYRKKKRTVYCARTSAEALSYLVAASREDRLAVVLSAPLWSDALKLKGYALIELGRVLEARAALEQAVLLSPANAGYLSELAFTYQATKEWEQARDVFQRAADATAMSPEPSRKTELGRALRGLGYALVELERLDEAEAVFRRCLDLDPADTRAVGELAHLHALRAARQRPRAARGPRRRK
jgi:tetratricopeptide (TPR) repeat protein